MIICKTSSPEQTLLLGQKLAGVFSPGDVLCIAGTLGAGKTLLTQGIVNGLHADSTATSPTFSIMNVYQAQMPVYHFDLYRLERLEELEDIGFGEYTGSALDGLAIIEWPDRFIAALPEEYLWVDIQSGDREDERTFTFRPAGTRYEQMCEEVRQYADTCFRYSQPCI